MKQTAYLINTSRGELVDEDALYNALESELLPVQPKMYFLKNLQAKIINYCHLTTLFSHPILAHTPESQPSEWW